MSKKRLDNLLLDRSLAATLAKARAMILAGEVYVNGVRVSKAGQSVDEESDVEIRSSLPEFVSRGGIKLAHALKEFNLDVTGSVCVDIGASTGGFTDCLLKGGAKKVYAIDVGYGQLDFSLRKDKRVVVIDKTNIRNFDTSLIKESIDLVTIDVSFIGLEKVFPKVNEILNITPLNEIRDTSHEPRKIIALVKPQFQAGKGKVGNGGVVRGEAVRREAVDAVKVAAASLGWRFEGITESPIRGMKGNIEYLARWVL